MRCSSCLAEMRVKGGLLVCPACGRQMEPMAEDPDSAPTGLPPLVPRVRPQRRLADSLALAGVLSLALGLVIAAGIVLTDAEETPDETLTEAAPPALAPRVSAAPEPDPFESRFDLTASSSLRPAAFPGRIAGDLILLANPADAPETLVQFAISLESQRASPQRLNLLDAAELEAATLMNNGRLALLTRAGGRAYLQALEGGEAAWTRYAGPAPSGAPPTHLLAAGDSLVLVRANPAEDAIDIQFHDAAGEMRAQQRIDVAARTQLLQAGPDLEGGLWLALNTSGETGPEITLYALSADGGERLAVKPEVEPGARLAALAPAPGGALTLAFTGPAPALIRLDAAGALVWRQDLPAMIGEDLVLAPLGQGVLIAASWEAADGEAGLWLGEYAGDGTARRQTVTDLAPPVYIAGGEAAAPETAWIAGSGEDGIALARWRAMAPAESQETDMANGAIATSEAPGTEPAGPATSAEPAPLAERPSSTSQAPAATRASERSEPVPDIVETPEPPAPPPINCTFRCMPAANPLAKYPITSAFAELPSAARLSAEHGPICEETGGIPVPDAKPVCTGEAPS